MKILLIDDDELMRNALQTFLERKGHEVFLYETGDGAVAYAEKLGPDVTLTDHNLGPCDKGLKIARTLMEKGQKAVLMSGDNSVRGPSLDLGVPFVLKGDVFELLALVEGVGADGLGAEDGPWAEGWEERSGSHA